MDYYHCYYLQAEKGQVELTEALESTKKALELRIDELLSEKEGAITAVRAELVESSKHTAVEKVTTSIINPILHSERPKLHTILAFLSAIGLNADNLKFEALLVMSTQYIPFSI